ncbi:NAD-dependent epimerase/dehydratase family protein [Brevibacillus choshinensis]|uniref:NAD-dependent epimerase/dehydratase family protein n=1 Tax=Brevibacillus choshinensis TaxID=54911 RepID=A0ABX7FKN9_BRECH|nr:NAD-dependent epimerase/dehydratase family protein [Brevibacillus choshinensis]QRG66237.1 NAD-dependent epimerase/dehydratase family protein [Brevibacillus choshinensis]
MKVLVTGGAGFIGSHIVDRLIADNLQVIVVDNLSTGRRHQVHPSATFYPCDITSHALEQIFEQEKPDAVIHQAAQVDVRQSMHAPLHDAIVNIIGTLRLLECSVLHSIQKFIYASSAAVYGKPHTTSINETHPIQPLSCYGISKYTPEQYIGVFSEQYGLNYTILRYANVYGERQELAGEGGVIPNFVLKMLQNTPPQIYGDGLQTRDFIHVEDVAAANVAALSAGDREVLNVATSQALSINDLVELLNEMMSIRIAPVYMPAREGDIRDSCLNNERTREVLQWEPQVSLHRGLLQTIHYVRNKMSIVSS